MTLLVMGILRSPIGEPVGEAEIRLTSITPLVGIGAIHATEEDGSYRFDLAYGTYGLEINQSDEFHLNGEIIVDEATPNPITLEELAKYSTPVIPPIIDPEDPDWDNKIDSLYGDVDSVQRTKLDQIRDGQIISAESKSIVTNDRLGASLADHSDQVSACNTGHVEKTLAYSSKDMSQAVTHVKASHTNQADTMERTELLENSNGKVSLIKTVTDKLGSAFRQVRTVLTPIKQTFSSLVSFGNSQRSIKESIGTDYSCVDSISNPTQTNTVTKTTTHTTQSVEQIDGIHKGNYHFDHGLAMEDARLVVRSQISSMVYGKKSSESVFNDGLISKNTKVTDLYQILAEGGQEVFTLDTVNRELNIKARLVISNPEDFQGPSGDTIFEVYRYAKDDPSGAPLGPNWHDEYIRGDRYRIFNQSVNGKVNPAKWSAPINLYAEDGLAGDTLYIEYQYSVDKSGWHPEPMTNNDVWRRERTVTNFVPAAWSDASRIRGFDGAEGYTVDRDYQYTQNAFDPQSAWHENFSQGDHFRRERVVIYLTQADYEEGIHKAHSIGPWVHVVQIVPMAGKDYGAKQTPVYLFQRSATMPAKPTGELTYDFAERTLEPASNFTSTGWKYQASLAGENRIWIAVATASTQTNEDVIQPNEWSVSEWLADGSTQALCNLFCVYNGPLALPPVKFTSVTQNLDTGVVVVNGSNAEGWQGTFPKNIGDSSKVWYVTNVKLSPTKEVIHTVDEFTTPDLFLQNGSAGTDGKDGVDGVNGKVIKTMFKASATKPAKPTGTAVPPAGWSDNPIVPPTGQVAWVSYTFVDSLSSTTTSTGWTEAGQWSGTNGIDGMDGMIAVFVFKSAATIPARPTDRAFPPAGWSKTPPASIPAGHKTWVTMSAAVSTTSSTTVADWSAVGQYSGNDGNNGNDGRPGTDGNFGAGSYIWDRGSGSVLPTQLELDNFVVSMATTKGLIKGASVYVIGINGQSKKDTRYYVRQEDGGVIGTVAWKVAPLVVNGDAIVEGTLAANKLMAQSITGDLINATTTLTVGSGDQVAKLSGTGGIRMAVGNANMDIAPFRVEQNGRMVAANAHVVGKIEANEGYFRGSLEVDSQEGAARMTMRNNRIEVYDAHGRLRVRIGKLA